MRILGSEILVIFILTNMPSCMSVCSITQSCPTLWNLMDCSPPSSSIHGIIQARILELVAIFFFSVSSQPTDRIHDSCSSCISRQILLPLSHLGSSKKTFLLIYNLRGSNIFLFLFPSLLKKNHLLQILAKRYFCPFSSFLQCSLALHIIKSTVFTYFISISPYNNL